jgi:chemotaxis protein CheD
VRTVRVVGIGDLIVSDERGDILAAYGLGSCIVVAVYDNVRHVGGMLHIAYPESSANMRRARDQPGYFADTGVPLLLEHLGLPGRPSRRGLVVRLAGGASTMDPDGKFNIGKRNLLAVKRELWKLGFGVHAEDTGGAISRTARLDVDSGVLVITNGSDRWEL